jgi:hypothetical protein
MNAHEGLGIALIMAAPQVLGGQSNRLGQSSSTESELPIYCARRVDLVAPQSGHVHRDRLGMLCQRSRGLVESLAAHVITHVITNVSNRREGDSGSHTAHNVQIGPGGGAGP